MTRSRREPGISLKYKPKKKKARKKTSGLSKARAALQEKRAGTRSRPEETQEAAPESSIKSSEPPLSRATRTQFKFNHLFHKIDGESDSSSSDSENEANLEEETEEEGVSVDADEQGYVVNDSSYKLILTKNLQELVKGLKCKFFRCYNLQVKSSAVKGFSSKLTVFCPECKEEQNSVNTSFPLEQGGIDINKRMVGGFFAMGAGHSGMEKMGMSVGMHIINRPKFNNYLNILAENNKEFRYVSLLHPLLLHRCFTAPCGNHHDHQRPGKRTSPRFH